MCTSCMQMPACMAGIQNVGMVKCRMVCISLQANINFSVGPAGGVGSLLVRAYIGTTSRSTIQRGKHIVVCQLADRLQGRVRHLAAIVVDALTCHDAFKHVRANNGIVYVACNLCTCQPYQGICQGTPTCVDECLPLTYAVVR